MTRNSLKVFVPVILIAALATCNVVRWRPSLWPANSEHGRVVEPSTIDNVALQAKCYQQARSLYSALGYPKGRIAGYGNHYNQKLGTCFLDVMNVETAAPDALWLYQRVIDAVTGTEHAAYAALVRPDGSAWEAPQRCEVRLPSGERRLCRSEEEFALLADLYMEQ